MPDLTPEEISVLGGAADLPLAGDRAAILAPAFSTLARAANELNSKMHRTELRDLSPATGFLSAAGWEAGRE